MRVVEKKKPYGINSGIINKGIVIFVQKSQEDLTIFEAGSEVLDGQIIFAQLFT